MGVRGKRPVSNGALHELRASGRRKSASSIARADRIAARLSVTRATGASAGKGSGITPSALRSWGHRALPRDRGREKSMRCVRPHRRRARQDPVAIATSGQLRIGRLTGRAIIGVSFDYDRQHAGALWQEMPGNHRDIAQRVGHRDQAVISGNDRDAVPVDAAVANLSKISGIGDLPPGSATSACPRASSALQ